MPLMTRNESVTQVIPGEVSQYRTNGWSFLHTSDARRFSMPEPSSHNPEANFSRVVSHNRDIRYRQTVSVGTVRSNYPKYSGSPHEGWAKTLNLLRTFVKIRKNRAVEKSNKGWLPVEHDIEYLFRYMGLGYENDKPVLFTGPSFSFPKTEIRIGEHSECIAIIEFPDKKVYKIGKAIQKILSSPKLYKELQGCTPNLGAMAEEMVVVGCCHRRRNEYEREEHKRLGRTPHIYLFAT